MFGFLKLYRKIIFIFVGTFLVAVPFAIYLYKSNKVVKQKEKIEELEKNITLQAQNQDVAVENAITQSNAERRAKVLEEIKQEIKEFEANETNDTTEYNSSIFNRVFFYDQD